MTFSRNFQYQNVERNLVVCPFSFVQLVKNGNDLYALKRVLIQVPEHEQMVTREVNAHNMLSHPNVMPLVDYEVVSKGDDKEARLLFPYYKNGSIQELIENSQSRGDRIAEKKILKIFRSLCDGVDAFHCHNPPYAHRDIKPHNVLFKDDGSICLMDMGSVDLARVNITCRWVVLFSVMLVSSGGDGIASIFTASKNSGYEALPIGHFNTSALDNHEPYVCEL
eukprot:gene6780-7545_t